MEFKAAKCPNCQGDLQLPESKEIVKCMYCGTDIQVQKAIQMVTGSVNLENITKLAETAFESRNFTDAIKYYSQILENDSQNYTAWFYKGLSNGWQANVRETIECYKNAIKIAGQNYPVLSHFADELATLAYSYVMAAQKKVGKFREWDALIEVSKKGFEIFEFAWQMHPSLHIAHLADSAKAEIIETTVDTIGQGLLVEGAIILEKKDQKKERLIWEQRAKSMDPNWKKAEKNCFVATATMGDFDHPYVLELRYFRDHFLLTNKLGKISISIYYFISPGLANYISHRPALRKISLFFIVKPAVAISALLRRLNRE